VTSPSPLGPELRRLLVPVYFPWAMVTLGAGVLLPVFPLYLEQSGLRLSFVGLVTASAGIGSALGGIPSSSLAERRGTDRLLVVSLTLTAGTAAVLGYTDAVAALVVLRISYGVGWAGVTQSRQLLVARSVELRLRGRVNSWIGGMHRLTFVFGPLLGGWVYNQWGANAAFSVAGGLTAVGLAWIVLPGGRDTTPVAHSSARVRIGPSLWRYRRLLLTAGLGPLLVMSARAGRHVVIPLIGDELALDPAAIGVLVAVGTTADFLLFPISGYVMDRWGRLASMVPAFSLMAFGLLLLGLADSVTEAVVAGIVMGVGNGLSSGTMLTLSTDLAPPDEPGPFIAGFHTLSGAGTFVGPLLVGWVADAYGLSTAAIALAVTLALGVAWIALVIGETGRVDE
jgi:MFS family permease